MTATSPAPLTPALTELRLSAPSSEIVNVPFSALRPNPHNPRREFPEAELRELAANIYERTVFGPEGSVMVSGLLQNLLGRPDAGREGGVELAAGGRRYRALALLVEGLRVPVPAGEDANGRPLLGEKFCQIRADYPVPVRVQDMTDAEMLEAATTENLHRQDMKPMELADAYLNLRGKGLSDDYIAVRHAHTVAHGNVVVAQALAAQIQVGVGKGLSDDYIAVRYGVSVAHVRDMTQLAAGLGREGRKLFDEGTIGLDAARVIAATTGDLKKQMLDSAQRGWRGSDLLRTLRQCAFVVENAIFDVAASGLRVSAPLLGDLPERFEDMKAALALQLAATEARAQQVRDSGEWPEVLVISTDDPQAQLDYQEWTSKYGRPQNMPGVFVVAFSTSTGRVREHEDVARKADVEAWSKSRAQGQGAQATEAAGTPTPKIRDAAHRLGHQARAQALDAYHAAHPQQTLALVCAGLIVSAQHGEGVLGLRVEERGETPVTAETRALAQTLSDRLGTLFGVTTEGLLGVRPTEQGGRPTLAHVLDVLCAEDMTYETLAQVLTYYTHRDVAKWTNPRNRPSATLSAYAARVGADSDLPRHFPLSAEYLGAYTVQGLHDLIQTMPLALRPAVRPGISKKDMIPLLTAQGPALAAAGWTPPLVTFAA